MKCVDCGALTYVPSHYQHVPTVCDGCMKVRRERLAAYRLEFSKWSHTSRTMAQPQYEVQGRGGTVLREIPHNAQCQCQGPFWPADGCFCWCHGTVRVMESSTCPT